MRTIRVDRELALTIAVVASGCAGAFGSYGPGMTNLDRAGSGCASNGDGTATCSGHSYNSGDRAYGAQIGVRTGAVSGTAGDIGSGTGLANDAHADVTVGMDKRGGGLQFGYSNDQTSGDLFYWGLPVVAYGQYSLSSKIFVHAGAGRVFHGEIRHAEMTAEASGWRAVAGISFVFARSATRDLALRLEARAQTTGDAQIGGVDASWTSTGLLAEIVWASY